MSEQNHSEEIKEDVKEELKDDIKETKKEEKKEKAKKKQEEPKSMAREALEWIICVVVAFSVAVVIKYFLFTPTLVKQNSMYPTIYDGERVFVNRLVRTFKLPIHRGDIVTLEAPREISGDHIVAQYNEYTGLSWLTHDVIELGKISYIKRVIGIAGDTIKFGNAGIYRNGVLLDESEYLPDGTKTELPNMFNRIKTEFVVPEGYIFAMGDNREYSRDCRELGCIPIEKVEGRVVGRIWPLSKFGKITKADITREEINEHNSVAIAQDLLEMSK